MKNRLFFLILLACSSGEKAVALDWRSFFKKVVYLGVDEQAYNRVLWTER